MQYSRAQIDRWRRAELQRDRLVSYQQKLDTTMSLFHLGCDMMRSGIRAQHPEASPAEIEKILRRRIERGKRWRKA